MIGKVRLHENQDKPHAARSHLQAGSRPGTIFLDLQSTAADQAGEKLSCTSCDFIPISLRRFPPLRKGAGLAAYGREFRGHHESSGDTIVNFSELGMVSPELFTRRARGGWGSAELRRGAFWPRPDVRSACARLAPLIKSGLHRTDTRRSGFLASRMMRKSSMAEVKKTSVSFTEPRAPTRSLRRGGE